MTKLEFTAEVISALAWPVVLIGLALAFGKPIRTWLKRQPSEVSVGPGGWFQAKWTELAAEAETALDVPSEELESEPTETQPGAAIEAGAPAVSGEVKLGGEGALTAEERVGLTGYHRKLGGSALQRGLSAQGLRQRRLSERQDLLRLIQAISAAGRTELVIAESKLTEARLRQIYAEAGMEAPEAGLMRLSSHANEHGLITLEASMSVQALAHLRSLAIHGEALLTEEQVADFIDLAIRTRSALEDKPEPPAPAMASR